MRTTAGYFQHLIDDLTPPREVVKEKDNILKLLQGAAAQCNSSWVVSTQGSMLKGTATVTSDLDFLVDDSRSGALDKDTVDLFVERVRAALDRQGYDVQLVEKGTVAWPHFEVVTPTKLELEGEVVFASVVRTSAMKLLVWEASMKHDMPKLKGVVLEGLARHLIDSDASLLRNDQTGLRLYEHMLLCLAFLEADEQPSRQLRETVEAALGHELRAWTLQDQEVWRWADLAADTHARLATGGYGMHEVELLCILTAAEYQP